MRVEKTVKKVEDLLKRKWVRENGRSIRVYRRLAEIYIGRKLKKDEDVHHKDRNQNNNSIENLEVLSHGNHVKLHYKNDRRNIAHLWKHLPHELGEKHPRSLFKDKDVIKMKKLYKGGKKKIYEIAELFNANYKTVYSICTNYSWKHI